MDTSETPPGKRNRAIVDAAGNSDELHDNREGRHRVCYRRRKLRGSMPKSGLLDGRRGGPPLAPPRRRERMRRSLRGQQRNVIASRGRN